MISFSKQLKSFNCKLIELPDGLQLDETSDVSIKEDGDVAVLCSGDKTYEMKRVETSNSLLLMRERNVLSMQQAYIELIERKPSLRRLKQLLIEAGDNGLLLSELVRHVPAARQQILDGLRRMRAVNDGERWVLIGRSARIDLLKMALSERALGGDEQAMIAAMQRLSDAKYTPSMLAQLIVALESDAKRFVAQTLLEKRERWPTAEFVVEWQLLLGQSLGLNAQQDLKALLGVAYCEHACVVALDEAQLSLDADVRLAQLFAKREQWPIDELQVYLNELLMPRDVAKLIARKTRKVGELLIFKR